MKKNIVILLFVGVCVVTTILILLPKCKTADGDTISRSQVREAIDSFANFVDPAEVPEFGLNSIAEIRSLKGGKQFKRYIIDLNDIQKYKAGEDVGKMIKEYPAIEVALVNDSGHIRTAVEFVKYNGKWKAAAWGSSPEFTMVIDAQSYIKDTVINQGKLIRIPALHISFIAISSGAGLEFFILKDDDSLQFKKGEKKLSTDVILKLVPIAKTLDELPN